MKADPHKQKVVPTKDAAAPRRRLRRCARLLGRGLTVCVLVALAAAVWTHRSGFPELWVRRAEAGLAQRWGGQFRIGALGWDVERGLVARHVAWFRHDADLLPAVEAEEVSIARPLAAWFETHRRVWHIQLRDGWVRYAPAGPLRSEDPRETMTVEVWSVEMTADEHLLCLVEGRGRGWGITFDVEGNIHRAKPGPGVARASADPSAWMRSALDYLRQVEVEGRSTARVRFDWHPDRPLDSMGVLAAGGGALRIRGARFDAWGIEATFARKAIEPVRLALRLDGQEVEAEAALDLAAGSWSGRLRSEVPAPVLASLLPEDLALPWTGRGDLLGGALDLAVEWGPSPLADPWNQVEAQIRAGAADLFGVWLEKASFRLQRRGATLVCDEIEAQVGRGPGAGPARGRFTLDVESGEYRVELETGFDPALVFPVLPRVLHSQLRAFAFRGALPHGQWQVRGQGRRADAFTLRGEVSARQFHYQGVYVEQLQAGIAYANRALRLEPFALDRAEGGVRGWIHLDFARDEIRFAAESSIGLHPAARMIHPKVADIVDVFRAEGAARVQADGFVDYRDPSRTRVDMSFDAENVGYKWILADAARWSLQVRGPVYSCQDFQGTLYGGVVAGRFVLEDREGLEPLRYEVETEWDKVDFGRLAMQLKDSAEDPYRGVFSGSVKLSGEGNAIESIRGSGRMAIRGAQIFRVPLLGGLSRYLSFLLPGFGYATPSDVRCRFDLADGKATSSDALIRGNLVTIRARGDYYFDRRLNVLVEAEPLGKGVIGDAVRLISTPLSALLRFHLHGTVSEPVWSADSWPAELLRRLEGVPQLFIPESRGKSP